MYVYGSCVMTVIICILLLLFTNVFFSSFYEQSFLTYRIAATLQLLIFFFIAVFCFHPNSYVTGKSISDIFITFDFFRFIIFSVC